MNLQDGILTRGVVRVSDRMSPRRYCSKGVRFRVLQDCTSQEKPQQPVSLKLLCEPRQVVHSAEGNVPREEDGMFSPIGVDATLLDRTSREGCATLTLLYKPVIGQYAPATGNRAVVWYSFPTAYANSIGPCQLERWGLSNLSLRKSSLAEFRIPGHHPPFEHHGQLTL